MRTKSRYLVPVLSIALLAGLCSTMTTQAQGLYRSVGPDGRVTFSDIPPPQSTSVTELNSAGTPVATNANANSGINLNQLPTAVRRAWTAYPVTLYTTNSCSACEAGRAHLQDKGIPFIEFTVNTPQDMEELRRRVSTTPSFPTLSIGTKTFTGFNSSEWQSYLDAAGYPQTSELPRSYRNPAARPLTPPHEETPPPATTPAQMPSPTPQRPANERTADNPAGIRF